MKAIKLKAPGGLTNLMVVEIDEPSAGPGELLIRVRASSLNFHDYWVVKGAIKTEDGRIPMSDGAGDVIAVGDGVTLFQAGDKVVSTFFPLWQGGEATPAMTGPLPGDRIDGYAREYIAVPASAVTRAPPGYSHAEAATLTCAGLTAWRGLVVKGRVKPGDCVLVQGSGGVAIFALQFAKAAGATVIATTSSDAKAERLKQLGADHVINYQTEPDWGRAAKQWTGGRGVDQVIETGGAGTLAQSMKACRLGGHIALIGMLTGVKTDISLVELFSRQLHVSGITVGSRADQEDMIRAIAANGLKPVIDSSFPLEEIAAAFSHQAAQKHFGKICLEF